MACIGVIGGTGLEEFADLSPKMAISAVTRWDIVPTPLVRARVGENELVFLSRHGEKHNIAPHKVNYRANIAALQQSGVDAIIAVNAVGGIAAEMLPGDLVIPDQLIDYTWGREHTFFAGEFNALKHIDFTSPYSEPLRQALAQYASEHLSAEGMSVHNGGVHGVTQGPRLETAAEVQRLKRDGCDIVGMTGMPEAALARELDIPYACLALVVNPAAGLSDREISMAEIKEVLAEKMLFVRQLLIRIAKVLD